MEKVEPALVPQRKLSNGMVIPGIGMGTFGNDRFSAEQTADAVYGAIQAGYRLFEKSSKKHFPMESYRDRI